MKFIKLSSGTKLLLLMYFAFTLTIRFDFYMETANITLAVFLFLLSGNGKSAIKFLSAFLILTAINLFAKNKTGVLQVIFIRSILIRKLIIPFAFGFYLLNSTKVSSLMATLEKLKLPKRIVIPLIVMFRFVPVLKEQYANIRNSMKIRGIDFGINSLKHPENTLEYLLVPFLFAATNIAEELSQAAFCKGADIDGKKERYFATKIGVFDYLVYIYLIIFTIFLARGFYA